MRKFKLIPFEQPRGQCISRDYFRPSADHSSMNRLFALHCLSPSLKRHQCASRAFLSFSGAYVGMRFLHDVPSLPHIVLQLTDLCLLE